MAEPTTVTSTLQDIFDNYGVAALGLAMPLLGTILKIPFVGPILNWGLTLFMNKAIAVGVIDVKEILLDYLPAEAQKQYALEIPIIRAAQAAGKLSADQQAQYDSALQDAIKNRPGIVNA